jgi:hypothetical protein
LGFPRRKSFPHHENLDEVQRVRGVRPVHRRIPHLLRVAVVGADERAAADAFERREQFRDTPVGHLDGLDRRGQRTGVAHHVGIGEVDHDQPVLAGENRFLGYTRHLGGRHLRLQVVGRNLGARRTRPLLTRERILAVVVEEKRHVRVLLRLRATELPQARVAHDFAEDVLQRLRLRRDHVHRQAALVLRHGRVIEVELRAALELLEAVDHKGPRDFARPVAPVIIEKDRIAVADRRERLAVGPNDPGRRDELVALLGRVERLVVIRLHRGGRRRGRGVRVFSGEHEIRLAHALPAVVAIHRPEAPAHGSDPAHADGAALLVHLLHVAESTLRRRVAAVGERMDEHLVRAEPVLLRLAEDAVEVLEHAVHAGIADDAHQVEPCARP